MRYSIISKLRRKIRAHCLEELKDDSAHISLEVLAYLPWAFISVDLVYFQGDHGVFFFITLF